MTRQEALEHYNSLTGANANLNSGGEVFNSSINAFMEVDEMCAKAGGKLQSRQVMAQIIWQTRENLRISESLSGLWRNV